MWYTEYSDQEFILLEDENVIIILVEGQFHMIYAGSYEDAQMVYKLADKITEEILDLLKNNPEMFSGWWGIVYYKNWQKIIIEDILED